MRSLSNDERRTVSSSLRTAAKREACLRSYYFFVQTFWHTVEKDGFVDNWHIEYLCNRLQAIVERIARGERRENHLVVNIPPRSSKTTLFGVFLNAWAWAVYPQLKIITISYSDTLTQKSSIRSKLCMESDLYRDYFGDVWQFSDKKNTNSEYWNTRGGFRFATSVGGTLTGEGADLIVFDDLLSAYDAHSAAMREAAYRFLDDTARNRLNMPDIGQFVLMGQRVHVNDPTGMELRRNGHLWECIVLPAMLAGPPVCVLPSHLERWYCDGYLEPIRLGASALGGLSKSDSFVTQYLQCPELQVVKGKLYAKAFEEGRHLLDLSGLVVDNDVVYLAMDANTRPYCYCLVMKSEVLERWDGRSNEWGWGNGDVKRIRLYGIDEVAMFDNIEDTISEVLRRLREYSYYARDVDNAKVWFGGDSSLNTVGVGKKNWESNFSVVQSALGGRYAGNLSVHSFTKKQIMPQVVHRGEWLNMVLGGMTFDRCGVDVQLVFDSSRCRVLVGDMLTTRVSEDGGVVIEKVADIDGVKYELNGHPLSALSCLLVQRFYAAYQMVYSKNKK